MFLDEDEDLAHEFYEECPIMVEKIEYSVDTVVRWTMKRIKRNLKPEVKHTCTCMLIISDGGSKSLCRDDTCFWGFWGFSPP